MGGRAVVERLLADPPRVHAELSAPPELGVWLTERECYELIAARCTPGSRTLETGLGLSTALFLVLGTDHTCVVPSETQVAELRRYCDERGISTDGLHVAFGRSEDVLPTLRIEPVDLVLIDGSHGFPTPMIDWFYGAGLLRRGGAVVLDDRQLPAVAMVVSYLDADPRWRPIGRTAKWAAFERLTDDPLAEDWYDQTFFPPARSTWRRVLRRLLSRPAISRVVTTPLRQLALLLPADAFLRVPVVRQFDVRIPNSDRRFRMHSGGDDDVALLAFWHGLEGRASRPGKPTASEPDAETLRVLLELGGRCRTFLDVGANVGLYALAMATAHRELLVHAFEPAPATFERLQRNVALNDLPNLFLHREALAADVGNATLHVPRRSAPLDASLLEGMRPDTDPVTVATTTVDAFARSKGISVDLLKVDTEGTEDRVLAGAADTLAADAPFVVCEVLSGEPAEPHVGSMLADIGYEAFRITATGPQPVAEVRGDPAYAELNFLFAHRDRVCELPFVT